MGARPSPDAAKVLELALREVLSLGHNYIATEHILLGLIRHEEGLAARVLDDLDANRQTLRGEVMRRLSGTGSARRSPSVEGAKPGQAEPADEELEGMLAELTDREQRVSSDLRILRGKIDILRAELRRPTRRRPLAPAAVKKSPTRSSAPAVEEREEDRAGLFSPGERSSACGCRAP